MRLSSGEGSTSGTRDELLATVSHELRTPLTSIVGYAELIEDLGDDELGPTARRWLGIIRRNADRELRLVDDLLMLAFLEDELPISRHLVDVAQLVKAVVDDSAERAADAGIQLTAVAPRPARVRGDAQRLGQMVDNLLTNALKFTPSGGRVEVWLRDIGPSVVLEVRDTGMGIEADEVDLIFERLYRTSRAVEQQIQGAGLGLPIVKAIVAAHGGGVDVESRPDAGSVFRVVLPSDRPH